MRYRAIAIGFATSIAVVHTASCGLWGTPSPAEPGAGAARRVAVLPFRVGGLLDSTGRFVEAANGTDIADDLGTYVASKLSVDLAGLGAGVVPSDVVLRATPVAGAALYDTKHAARVAREVGAEAAVMGAVQRFVQRQGSALSVERPASVAYQAMVVAAETGVVIGNWTFDYTQKPLAEDLINLPDFLQGGGKWRTREEIIDRSLEKTAAKIADTLRTPPTGLGR